MNTGDLETIEEFLGLCLDTNLSPTAMIDALSQSTSERHKDLLFKVYKYSGGFDKIIEEVEHRLLLKTLQEKSEFRDP